MIETLISAIVISVVVQCAVQAIKKCIKIESGYSLFNRIKSLFKNEKVAQGFAIGSIVLSGGLLATRLLNKAKK